MAARFPRVYESPGEDPRLTSVLGVASVQGLQGMEHGTAALQRLASAAVEEPGVRTAIPGNLTRPDVVAATAKHFIGCAEMCLCQR